MPRRVERSAMEFRPYHPIDKPAALALRQRLQAHDPSLSFPIPENNHPDLCTEPSEVQLIVAADSDGIHGGYSMRCDHYRWQGKPVLFYYFGYPISEGLLSKQYATLGLQLQRDIQKRAQLAYGLGGGGIQSRVNQLKIRGGWSADEVPCFFYCNRTSHVLEQLPALQRGKTRSTLARILAKSGLGAAGVAAFNFLRSRKSESFNQKTNYQIVSQFPEWVDTLYEQCSIEFDLIARRDRTTLKKRFPIDAPHLNRGIVTSRSRRVGWFTTLEKIHNKAQYFGDLKVGLIADFLAPPEHVDKVIWAATQQLRQADCDLIICNASHSSAVGALNSTGFFQGPSNFPMLVSPQLGKRLGNLSNTLARLHIVRADGDSIQAMLPAQLGSLRRAA